MSKHLYALHDYDPVWASQVKATAKTAWVVETLEIGDDPANMSGGNFTDRGSYGLTVIGRLNYSHHGTGTIPVKDRYDEFATRCGNYVRSSKGCTLWHIGNEPNIKGERPDNNIITPADYIRCYKGCRNAIKAVSPDHQVMIATVAPYNDESGWCVDYWQKMIEEMGRQGTTTDGFPLHTYSRGPDPASIRSEQKMGGPYSSYYNGFRAYRDFLAVIPYNLSHLPVYITETDQLDPWADKNSGWVREAYREIDDWNHRDGQKISCLALYRWPHFDQWYIEGKQGVITDFHQTLTGTNYLVPQQSPPSPPSNVSTVTVTAPAGANIRSGPATTYPVIQAMPYGTVLTVTGKSGTVDDLWWRVEEPAGWVSDTVVTQGGTAPSPTPTVPSTSQGWLVTALARVVGIDPLVAQAILAIESGGSGFGPDGRLTIRFEAHLFLGCIKQSAPDKLPQAQMHFRVGDPPWTGQEWDAGNGWQPLHDQGQAEEYAAFTLARNIDESCAYNSISMGASQILGSNAHSLGYASPQAIYAAFSDKERGGEEQVVALFSYLRARGLIPAAAAKDWTSLARGYNGSGAVSTYASLLHQKYLALGGTD